MIPALSKRATDAIIRHDEKVYQVADESGMLPINRTRFYKWLVRRGNAIDVHTVAVKNRTRGGETVCKEVVRASTAESLVFIKDLACLVMAGYVVDWSPEKMGPERQWGFYGQWGSDKHNYSSMLWKIKCSVLNPEVIDKHERFKYCAYSRKCGDVLDYLKLYQDHPKIEILTKAGLRNYSVKPSLIKLMDKDRNFGRFFRDNIEEIKREQIPVSVILKSYRSRCSFEEATKILLVAAEFRRNGGRLHGIDPVRALSYVESVGTCIFEYCRYIAVCVELGYDVKDTKTCFPHNFKRRVKEVYRQKKEIEDARTEQKRKDNLKIVREVADRMKEIEKPGSVYSVCVPKTENDLLREGKILSHCLYRGCFEQKIAKKESIILFVRKSEAVRKPYVTVEYDLSTGDISQCYARKNSRPDESARKFVYGGLKRRVSRIVDKNKAFFFPCGV